MPNVLLFITDQQRWDTLGYTGRTSCRTPNVDRLARDGVTFDRCITPCPICSPARASLFTGRYAHATGVQTNDELPLERPTVLEAFQQAGYHIGYSGKWHLGRGRGAAAMPEWQGERGEGYQRWLDEHNYRDTYPYRQEGFVYRFSRSDRPAVAGQPLNGWISSPSAMAQEGLTEWTHEAWVAARALEYLETRPRDRPFFHVCSFVAPHPIFVIPEPYYSLYDPDQVIEPPNFRDPMAGKPSFQTKSPWHGAARAHGTAWEPWSRSMAVYWGMVTYLDELIGRVLGRLEALGLADDTIVVMTSDHGENMGSHGLFQKSSMYEESLRVPLVLRAPRTTACSTPSGRAIDAPVSLADVAPTLLGMAGLGERGRDLLEPQGRDLSGWVTGQTVVPGASRGASPDPSDGAVFSEYKPTPEDGPIPNIRAVVGPRYKYAWNQGHVAELYDTWADPTELHNLAEDPALSDVRRRLDDRLVEWMRATEDPLLREAEK